MRQKSALENYAFEDVYKILQELSEFKCSMLEMAQALVWDFREIFLDGYFWVLYLKTT